jgi:uncharacterized membrane protein
MGVGLRNLQKLSLSDTLVQEIKKPRNYILLVFATIYCLISLVNHYNFRTYAFDLGIYNNCLYQYGHFHKNHYPYLHYMFTNFLSDHFSLYTVILSPLHYIFGSYTLLYIQILSVLFGSLGIYKIIKRKFDRYFLPEIAMIHYLSFFGIYSALSFDYHDNVVSAMLMPWFFYFFDSGKVKKTILFALLIVIGKENMPIWLAFVCMGLTLLYFKEKSKRNLALILGFSSILYAIIVFKIIMPGMDPMVAANGYQAFKYSVLGSNLHEIISNLVQNPSVIIKAFFYNHLGDAYLDKIKPELYTCLLYSGGILLLFKPEYILMLIPIIAQKVLSDDFGKWGINAHYSIEFAPIVVIGFYDALLHLRERKVILMVIALAGCFSSAYITKKKIDARDSIYYNNLNSVFYRKEHYQCEFDRKELKRIFNLIPENASLSSSHMLAPHLSFRKNIYQFPDLNDAEYILLADSENGYPLRGEAFMAKVIELKNSKEWETVSDAKNIYLFRKRR